MGVLLGHPKSRARGCIIWAYFSNPKILPHQVRIFIYIFWSLHIFGTLKKLDPAPNFWCLSFLPNCAVSGYYLGRILLAGCCCVYMLSMPTISHLSPFLLQGDEVVGVRHLCLRLLLGVRRRHSQRCCPCRPRRHSLAVHREKGMASSFQLHKCNNPQSILENQAVPAQILASFPCAFP